ncbi:MAG: hypothetical protein ACJ735_09685 [Actinomycetes bacterium]
MRVPLGDPKHRLLLVSSSGGVLLELLALRHWWQHHDVRWLAVPGADTRDVLRDQAVTWTAELRPRHPLALLRSLLEAWRLLADARIDAVISAGTGVAVPVFLAARLRGVPAYWIETLNVVGRQGLASRLCGRLATQVLVQNVDLLAARSRAVFVGQLY